MDTIDFSTIGLSDIPCYAACFNLTKQNVEYFDIRDFYGKETKDILLASSAIPKIFSGVKSITIVFFLHILYKKRHMPKKLW